MKKNLLSAVLFLCGMSTLNAQKTYMLPLEEPITNDTERVMENNGQRSIAGVVKPSIEVYLPEASKANGCAVILCPGGGMRVLSWTSDVEEMAKLLNEHGIAAIGLKYRLNNGGMPKGIKMPPMVDVTGFQKFVKADCNPIHYPEGDSVNMCAVKDAIEAMKMVRSHAKEWNIDPERIGYLGFSAGGGVALGATVTAKVQSEAPNFICTNFGPSLMEVDVPHPTPPLLIMTRADHQNVAAGLLSLFLEWKKAGGNAELHMYGDGAGPYTLMPQTGNTTTELWSGQLLQWLEAKGMVKGKR